MVGIVCRRPRVNAQGLQEPQSEPGDSALVFGAICVYLVSEKNGRSQVPE